MPLLAQRDALPLAVDPATVVSTLVGGLWSVSYTDVIQMLVGLVGLAVLTVATLGGPQLGDGDPLRGLDVLLSRVAASHPDHLRLVPAGRLLGPRLRDPRLRPRATMGGRPTARERLKSAALNAALLRVTPAPRRRPAEPWPAGPA
jgi:hypothetical protein